MHYIVSTLEVASCCVESRCANKITKIQTMFVGVWYVCCVRVCVCAFVGEPSYLAVCLSEALMLQLLCIQMFMVTLLCVCWRLRAAE